MNQESRKAGKDLRGQRVTRRIIGAAIAVHRELGPGFLESIYEEALAVEFALDSIAFVRQKAIPLFFKDHQIGEHRLDFLVEDLIIVGLLLNFATAPLTIKRFCRERPTSTSDDLVL